MDNIEIKLDLNPTDWDAFEDDYMDVDDLNDENRMTLEEWRRAVEMGIFKSDDGCGYYGTENEISNIEVFTQKAPEGMNFVYWYNK